MGRQRGRGKGAGAAFGPGVEMFVDTARRPTFDRQRANVHDGRRTVDTILDRVVFGEPVFAEDMWMMHRIHEVSRHRNGECGLDVIVLSRALCSGRATPTRASRC